MIEKMKGPYGEEIVFLKKIPKRLKQERNSIWFVDSFFKKHSYFADVENIFFVKTGEKVKSIESLQTHLKKMMSLNANRETQVICVGGGSLGDSIGFLSSIYMRGVKLTMVPSTWLAAVDSSVGGKTALNCFGYKNLIGSFYPPSRIFFIEDLIGTSNFDDAEGEIYKTLLLNHNKKWAQKLLASKAKQTIQFSDLGEFIAYKSKIVKRDPQDLKGFRAVLNLGHTLGHAVELEKKMSHGEAVKQGCLFSIRWSAERGYLSEEKAELFEKKLKTSLVKISGHKLRKALQKDKKAVSTEELKFIFLNNKGPMVEKVKISHLIDEYLRQL